MTYQPRKRDGRYDRVRRKAMINVSIEGDGVLSPAATQALTKQMSRVLYLREKAFGENVADFSDLISGQASTSDVIEIMKSKYASPEVRTACAVYPDSQVVDLALNDEEYAVRVTALLDNPLCSVDMPGINSETMFMAICTLTASK